MAESNVKRIIIENFNTWKQRLELEFPVSGKVVIVGENGTGKSNVVRALEFLASHFPAEVPWDEQRPWDDTKPAELTVELSVPTKLRNELLRVSAMEMLRTIRPNVWSDANGATRAAEIFELIRKELDEGGLYQTLLLSYLTKPEWRGTQYAHCISSWNNQQIILLNHGVRTTRYRIAAEDWRVDRQIEPDQYLVVLIAERVLREPETAKWNSRNHSSSWEWDSLARIPRLTSEIKLCRSWLRSMADEQRQYRGEGEEELRPPQQEGDSIFATTLEEQRFHIQELSGVIQNIELALRSVPPIEDPIENIRSLIKKMPPFQHRGNLSSIGDIPLQQVLRRFLRDSVTILREDRGLLLNDDCPITVVTLDSVEEQLFAAKNSAIASKRQQFAKVQQVMRDMLELEMDVVVRASEEEDDDEADHSIVFSRVGSDVQFGLADAFGGAYEVALIATTLFLSDAQLVVLDEPGRNLHAPLRKDLCDLIYQQSTKKSVIMVTHDTEMLSAKRLDDVFYCKLHAQTGSSLVSLRSLATDQKMRTFMASPDFRETFFTKGVIFVEGMTDKRFLEAVSTWFETREAVPNVVGMEWMSRVRRIHRAIIALGSESQCVKAVKVARQLGIAWVFICDWDAVMPKLARGAVDRAMQWRGRAGKSVVKILREEIQLANTVLELEDVPDSWDDVRQLCLQNGVFSWEIDLEHAVRETRPNWEKTDWSTRSFDELVEFVGEMIVANNAAMLRLLSFLNNNGAFSMTPVGR
jgi:ABC-type Mn2+/Zn2+ transport system ATPase subunit